MTEATRPDGTRKDWQRLWATAGIANVADGLLLSGLPVALVQLGSSAAVIAGLQFVVVSGYLLVSLPSGAMADRSRRFRRLGAANLIRGTTIAALAAVALGDAAVVIAIFSVATVGSLIEPFVDVVTQAGVPEVVPVNRLSIAHSRLTTTQLVGNDGLGATIGGFLAVWGIPQLLGTAALLYVAAGVLSLGMSTAGATRQHAGDGEQGMFGSIVEGARFVFRQPQLRGVALANTAFNTGNTAFAAVSIIVFSEHFGLPAASFGFYLLVLAAGGICGGVALAWIVRQIGPRGSVALAGCLSAVAYVLLFMSSRPEVGALATFTLGAAGVWANVMNRLIRHRVSPDHLLGRVTASMRFIALALAPLGAIIGGQLASLAEARHTALVGVAGAVIATGLLLPAARAAFPTNSLENPGEGVG